MELSRRDFLLAGAATGAALGGLGLLDFLARGTVKRMEWAGKTVGAVQRIPSMCQSCTTACGVIATVTVSAVARRQARRGQMEAHHLGRGLYDDCRPLAAAP